MEEEEQNKTIMIRRSPVGDAAEAEQNAKNLAASKPVDVPPAPKPVATAWFKTPLGFGGVIVALVAIIFLVRSMTK